MGPNKISFAHKWNVGVLIDQSEIPIEAKSLRFVKIDCWLGEEDSNPRSESQSLMSCPWTIPQSLKDKINKFNSQELSIKVNHDNNILLFLDLPY